MVMATDAVEDVPTVVKTKTWLLPRSATTNLGFGSFVNANPSRFVLTPPPVMSSVLNTQLPEHVGGIMKSLVEPLLTA
jgi:hypothetical protein